MKNKFNSSNSGLFRRQISSLVKIYLPALLLIVAIWLIEKVSDISVYELVADPNEVGKIAPYVGLVSTLGVLLLCSGVSACFFSSYLIEVRSRYDQKWQLFLRCSGCLLLVLLIDDAFQLHENFSTLLFWFDSSATTVSAELQNGLETIVFGVYGLAFLVYGVYFRKLIYRTETLPLLLAFLFLVMSLVVDLLFENVRGHFVMEEGFKLLGIVSLITYYIKASFQKVKSF